jgi:hypothetical protein
MFLYFWSVTGFLKPVGSGEGFGWPKIGSPFATGAGCGPGFGGRTGGLGGFGGCTGGFTGFLRFFSATGADFTGLFTGVFLVAMTFLLCASIGAF